MTQLVRLTPDSSIKQLEETCLYNRLTDELYIVNEEAACFLKQCASGAVRPDSGGAAEFVDFCIKEGLLQLAREPAVRELFLMRSPVPSLRYLLLHITDRCNLKCRHCFQGDSGKQDLPVDDIEAVINEFEKMQGLRLIVSGGEPLLHRDFWKINDLVAGKNLRSILLTNGRLIDESVAKKIKFQEVQVSIDGMREAHDHLRGRGSFDSAVKAVRELVSAGVQVSVATMVFQKNLEDFELMADLMRDLGVREWSVDLPSPTGRMAENLSLMASAQSGGLLLDYAFGGSVHAPAPGLACGAHLMAVMANGDVARCGFYSDRPVGTIGHGLAACWERVDRIPLKKLECDCEFLGECRGGCRFRAAGYNNEYGPDPCQCYRYGVLK